MLLVFLLLLMTGVSDAQTVESESMQVTEGDAVTLPTDLSEIQNDDTILWMFGLKDFLISQIKRQTNLTSFFATDNKEFRGRLQVDQKTGSLTIRNTRTRHSGQYKLTISREKTIFKVFNVTVFVVVGETDGMKSVSVSVMEGDPVTLQTDSEIHQDALMLWRFGDKGILLAKIDIENNETSLNDPGEGFKDRLQVDQTGSLTIKNSRTRDSGLYELQIRGSDERLQRFLVSVHDPGLSSGVIAGIVVGVIVTLLLILIAFVIYYRRTIATLKSKMVEEKTVTEGESVTLHTGLNERHKDVTIQWCYETDDNLIAEISKGIRRTLPGADGRFRSKLKLEENTGDLTICNIRTIHSGLYKFKKSSSTSGTKYRRFFVSVNVKSVPVTAGGSVTLQTNATIQSGDLILWTFGAENLLVELYSEKTISERFKDRLELDKQTGSLTINNITDKDSGHFKLQIINKEQTRFRRFNVTVGDGDDSAGNQVNEVTPLLNENVSNGANGQEEMSSL